MVLRRPASPGGQRQARIMDAGPVTVSKPSGHAVSQWLRLPICRLRTGDTLRTFCRRPCRPEPSTPNPHVGLNPQPSTLSPSTLNPQPSTLNPNSSTFIPQVDCSALNPQPSTLHYQPSPLTPHPSTLQYQPSTLNPQSLTLNPHPQPSTLNSQHSTHGLWRVRVEG